MIDPLDAHLRDAVEADGMRCVVTPSVMSTPEIARSSWPRRRSPQWRVRASPSASAVHGDQPRWIRARTGDTANRGRSSGRAGADRRSGIGPAADHCPQVAKRRLHAGPDVDHESAPALARPDQRVDDVVDEHEVAGLTTVALERRRDLAAVWAREERRDDTAARPAGAARTTEASASAVNSIMSRSRYVDIRSMTARATTPRTPRGCDRRPP